MAIQSPRFTMRNLLWFLMVYKDSFQLGVPLHNRIISEEMSCKVEITLELVLSKNGAQPVEPDAKSAVIESYGIPEMTKIISCKVAVTLDSLYRIYQPM